MTVRFFFVPSYLLTPPLPYQPETGMTIASAKTVPLELGIDLALANAMPYDLSIILIHTITISYAVTHVMLA